METLIRGFTHAFKRNIGWQDRALRIIVGAVSVIATLYSFKTNPSVAIALAFLTVAQGGTVLSVRDIICYFMKRFTLTTTEKK